MVVGHGWSSVTVHIKRLSALTLLLALAACAGVSQKEYVQHRDYVAEKVRPGTPVGEAVQTLSQDGYRCKDQGDSTESSRPEDGLFRFCRYGVYMNVDMKRKTVTNTLPDILCVKKYP